MYGLIDFPRRGTIYWIDFPSQGGAVLEKRHPALILSNDANNQKSRTITVAPITGDNGRRVHYQVFVPERIGGLQKDSLIKLEQVSTLDKSLFGDYIGVLPREYMDAVVKALKIHLDIYLPS